MADPYHLQRFVDAQSGIYRQVVGELRAGRKRGHWMWFVFPQLKGLGRTGTAEHFGIASLAEARAYLDHPVLGPRLRECAAELAAVAGPIELVLGEVDALKLRSSMTLFARAAGDGGDPAVFESVLHRHYGGIADARTLEMLSTD
ncbi:MAG: DUF1810 domain-containing protein [Mycobacterium sp.]